MVRSGYALVRLIVLLLITLIAESHRQIIHISYHVSGRNVADYRWCQSHFSIVLV